MNTALAYQNEERVKGRDQDVAKIPQGAQEASQISVRNVTLEASLEGTIASKRCTLPCYTCMILIYSEKQYRYQFKSKADCF